MQICQVYSKIARYLKTINKKLPKWFSRQKLDSKTDAKYVVRSKKTTNFLRVRNPRNIIFHPSVVYLISRPENCAALPLQFWKLFELKKIFETKIVFKEMPNLLLEAKYVRICCVYETHAIEWIFHASAVGSTSFPGPLSFSSLVEERETLVAAGHVSMYTNQSRTRGGSSTKFFNRTIQFCLGEGKQYLFSSLVLRARFSLVSCVYFSCS